MKLALEDALNHSDHLLLELRPYFKRLEVAGSVRRRIPKVSDIELVGIVDTARLVDFKYCFRYTIIKGQIGGKYIRFTTGTSEVDLFFADRINWGYIFTLRTGPKEFNIQLVNHIRDNTFYKCEGGYIYEKTGGIVPVLEEKAFFDLIEFPYKEPSDR